MDLADPARIDAPVTADEEPFAWAGAALDRAGVRWCRLRDRHGGDDDLLVATADLRRARTVLAEAGFRHLPYPGHGAHASFFGFHEATGGWPKLDLVSEIDLGRWHEFQTDLADAVLARRSIRPGDPRPASDDAWWLLLLHELLDRPTGPIRRLDALREGLASAQGSGPVAEYVARRVGTRWREAVVAAVERGDEEALRRLGDALAQRLAASSRMAVRRRRFAARLQRRLDRIGLPWIRRGGTIALLGPDGSGKSALATRVGAGGPLPVRHVYLGLYGGRRAARAGRSRGLPGSATIVRMLAMWRGGLAAWWLVRRGALVIFDRHPLDARLRPAGGPPARGGWRARARRALLGRTLPRPDVVIVLDAPAETLVARKAEHPVEVIDAQRHAYLELATRLPATAVVDAAAPLDAVARHVTGVAWTTLAAPDPR